MRRARRRSGPARASRQTTRRRPLRAALSRRAARPLTAEAVDRGRAARSAQRLRRHQAPPGAPLPGVRRRARRRRDRPPLPQRLRPADAARTRPTPAWPASSGRRLSAARPRRCSRTAASGATSCTSHDVARANVLALDAPTDVDGRVQRGVAASRTPCSTWPGALAQPSIARRAITPRWSAATDPATSATCRRRPSGPASCLGFQAAVSVRRGHDRASPPTAPRED